MMKNVTGINVRLIFSILFILGGLLTPALGQRSGDVKRPNFVIIVADDLGFSDLSCYGGEMVTPNINRLASQGMQFSQFYAAGHCCPSRAALLTGLYAHRTGMGGRNVDLGQKYPAYRGNLNRNCITIAELLKNEQYQTAMVGKWHLSSHVGPRAVKSSWPTNRGFSEFYGNIACGSSYFQPYNLMHNTTPVKLLPKNFYYTEEIGVKAADYIRKMAKNGHFFLYVAFSAPHWPLQTPDGNLQVWKQRYLGGWDAIASRRRNMAILKFLVPKKTLQPKRPANVKPWTSMTHTSWEATRMAVYASQIDLMDQAVGKIMTALENADVSKETVVMFLSDNGASGEQIPQNFSAPYIATKTPNGNPVLVGNADKNRMPGTASTFQSYGPGWAYASNAPLRGLKGSTHEGGISVPFIVSWPGRIRARSQCHEIAHAIDVMPTVIELARTAYPKMSGGFKMPPLDGRSLLPLFRGEKRAQYPYFWEFNGHAAIRDGKYKLVKSPAAGWEFFALDEDRSETYNLINEKRFKATARGYYNQLREWCKEVGAQVP